MKKTIFLSVLLALICVSLFGCGKTTADYVESNMSEMTNVYFYGEGNTFYVMLSSGEREANYLVDGNSGESVSFALLSVVLNESSGQTIKAKVILDDTEQEIELELGANDQYMVDLEMALSGSEEISMKVGDESVELSCLSNDFAVTSNEAIAIASNELEEQIRRCKSGSKLNAECYLRVLDKKVNDFDGTFWCFSVINVNGESFSVIISTSDGSILAKSN